MFFSKKPKTEDPEYVHDVHEWWISNYNNLSVFESHLLRQIDESNWNELIVNFGRFLDFKVQIIEIGNSDARKFNMPELFQKNENGGEIIVGITNFGKQKWQITICEVILDLIDTYLTPKKEFIPEIIKNDEDQMRIFQCAIAAFLGVGILFLERSTIVTYYPKGDLVMKLTYMIPIDLNQMIYAVALTNYLYFDLPTLSRKIEHLEKSMKKEMVVCFKYCQRTRK